MFVPLKPWKRSCSIKQRLAVAMLVCLGWLNFGCYRYHAASITVFDAETDKNIEGAHIRTEYNRALLHQGPRTSHGVTNQNGFTRIEVADDPLGTGIDVSKEGYLERGMMIYPEGKPAVTDFPGTTHRKWPYDSLRVGLYAKPYPQVMLVLPNAYRGLLRIAEGGKARDLPCPPGKRLFEFAVDPAKTTSVYPIPYLGGDPYVRVSSARYVDGSPLSILRNGGEPDKVALRLLRYGNVPPDVTLFFVGTHQEVLSARAALGMPRWTLAPATSATTMPTP
jgi:hypothetical protein